MAQEHSMGYYKIGDTVEIIETEGATSPMYIGEVGTIFRCEGFTYYVKMDDSTLQYLYEHELKLIKRKKKTNVDHVKAFRIRALCYEDQLMERNLHDPFIMNQLTAIVKKARMLRRLGYNSSYIRKYADRKWNMIIGDVN